MKNAGLIRESYSEIEQFYLQGISDITDEKDFEKCDQLQERFRQLRERFRVSELAFFVLFWGQFESRVNEEGPFDPDLVFMGIIQLHCISANHPFYKDIDKYYGWRCDLAHGRTFKIPEQHLPSIFDRIEEIAEAMDEGSLPLGDNFDSFS